MYKEALDFYQSSIDMLNRNHNYGDHLDIAAALSNIGLVYEKQSELKKALEYFAKSLDMRNRILIVDNFELRLVGSNSAGKPMGRFQKVAESIRQTFDVKKRLFDSEHHIVKSYPGVFGFNGYKYMRTKELEKSHKTF